MLARARTALAMLMDMREMTSVWKKLATLLTSGAFCTPALPARSLCAYMHGASQ